MINFFSRVKSFSGNMRTLSPLLGGPLSAATYLVRSKGKGSFLCQGNYKGIPFKFRRDDISAVKEIFFKEEYGDVLKYLVDGNDTPVILDVGAHIGLFATWVFSLKPGAEVLSVEASPSTYKILEENTRGKKFLWKAINRAAWGESGHIRFSDESSSTMSHRVNGNGDKEIQTITLDDLVQGRQIDVLKVDIEGAEEHFLTGGNADLGNVKTLIIEIHPAYCSADRVMAVLKKNFVTIEDIKHGSDQKPVLLCRK